MTQPSTEITGISQQALSPTTSSTGAAGLTGNQLAMTLRTMAQLSNKAPATLPSVGGISTIDIPNADPADFPAGKVYLHGKDQRSTHLNVVVGDQSGYRFIPLLVPGQKNVEALLGGAKATPEQVEIAKKMADSRTKLYPRYKTPEEALAAEQDWRKTNIPRIEQQFQRLREAPR